MFQPCLRHSQVICNPALEARGYWQLEFEILRSFVRPISYSFRPPAWGLMMWLNAMPRLCLG